MSLAVAALIIRKPSSVIVKEGENVTLLCKASGRPTPTVTWVRALGHLPKGKTAVLDGKLTIQNVAKADSGTYACSAKNFLGKDSAFALITVTDRLKFTQTPPLKVSTGNKSNLMLNCAARGTIVIIWKRAGQSLPQNHVVYRNGTLLLRNFSPKDAGTYTCVAKNAYRSIEARTVVKLGKYKYLSENTSWHFQQHTVPVVLRFKTIMPSTDVIQLTLSLKMTTAQVVETSGTVNNNSPIQDYFHPDDQTQPTFKSYYIT